MSETKRLFTKRSLARGGRLQEVVAMRELTVLSCVLGTAGSVSYNHWFIFTLGKPQSQTKIVGTLWPNAVFSLLVLTSSLSKLLIVVRSPNLVHQH